MKGTIRFELRQEKKQKSGKVPIGLIYSIKGQRKRYSTGEVIFTFNWDAETQRGKYVSKKEVKIIEPNLPAASQLTEIEINEINNNLDAITVTIDNHEKDFIRKAVPFSSQMIIDLLNESKTPTLKQEDASNFIYSFIDQYIEDHSATRVKGSLGVYRALKVHLKAYEEHFNKRVTFSEIDYKFFQAFQNFLIQKRDLADTTVAKQLSTLKTFLGYARMHDVAINERYRDFKIKRQNLEVIALTRGEFESLLALDLSQNKRLRQVRDVFCFSCVTGLRYSDLKQLKREHIKDTEIMITVTKTKEKLSIPLSKYSQDILNIYLDNHSPLPVIAATNMNKYVKELCKLAGIKEPTEIVRYKGVERIATVYPKYELISIHTGRKTFATLSLENGMSAEEVMECTGHSDYKSFKRYVKVTEERKKLVIAKAWGAIN